MTQKIARKAAPATRYANAMIGVAAGDSWGYQVEFTSYDKMPAYPVPAPKTIWRISDDTQMTLALHDALIDTQDQIGNFDAITTAIEDRFLLWHKDPQNNRAPGATCMTSLKRLRAGIAWHEPGGALTRAGCGAVMRLVPAAFYPTEHWRAITALQAVITHKHPRAVAAALLLADAIRFAPQRHGHFLDHAISDIMQLLSGTSPWLQDEHLATVLAPITDDIAGYLEDGLRDKDHCLVDAMLDAFQVKRELADLTRADYGDPCTGIGQGWESATATAIGLLVADMATSDTHTPFLDGREALAWAATSNGDSDSIASIAGAIIGAAHTAPNYWKTVGVTPRFEPRYGKQLRAAPRQWAAAYSTDTAA